MMIHSMKATANCPKCGNVIQYTATVQNPHGKAAIGDVVVCNGCGSPLRLGVLGFTAMGKNEVDALDRLSRHVLKTAILSVLTNIAGNGSKN